MVGCARLKYFVASAGSGPVAQTEGHKGREPSRFLNSAYCDTERGQGDMLISREESLKTHPSGVTSCVGVNSPGNTKSTLGEMRGKRLLRNGCFMRAFPKLSGGSSINKINKTIGKDWG